MWMWWWMWMWMVDGGGGCGALTDFIGLPDPAHLFVSQKRNIEMIALLDSLLFSGRRCRGGFAFAALGFVLFVRWTRKRFQSMSWSLGPPIFGKEQIPVLLKKRKSASEFFGIVSSDAGRAWRKPSVYVIFQDEGALCEAPAPGCTGDGVPSRGKAEQFPTIRSGPGRGDWLNENVPGKGSFSVKTGAFMKYAAISYRFNLAAIA